MTFDEMVEELKKPECNTRDISSFEMIVAKKKH
jgi:hypothetical protein